MNEEVKENELIVRRILREVLVEQRSGYNTFGQVFQYKTKFLSA